MEWNDEGIILSIRPHGEHAAIVTALTLENGRHLGLVAGGQSKKLKPILQQGNQVSLKWRARTLEQLGTYTAELLNPYIIKWLDNQEVVFICASACVVADCSLPERQPMAGVYAALNYLLSIEDQNLFAPLYVKWEVSLLQALGYGLDLSKCAVTQENAELVYVSPKTGRAVSRLIGEPYKDKLLVLPEFLTKDSVRSWSSADIVNGLRITGYFLSKHVFSNPQSRALIPIDGQLPHARQRLMNFFKKKMETSDD
ncbi:MAG: DNA repair protein RecO [Alphaproteobacteria bacterium]|nr:DNA repair protein RecO [Alphaproteobacteria bacterium]MCL2504730.1 DNA repair protein RecO [Alphaproteobacteria bacterium]